MWRYHWVITARHHHHVVVLNRTGFVDVAVVRIDPLERKTLRRAEPVVIGFLQLGFGRRCFGIVFVRRVTRRMPGRGDDLDHQQVRRGRVVVGQDVADIPRITALATHAAFHGGRVYHPHRTSLAIRRGGAQGDLGIPDTGHADGLAGGHVNGRRRYVLEYVIARAHVREMLTVHRDVDRAGQHHHAAFG